MRGDTIRMLWRAATGLATLSLLPFRSRDGGIAPFYGGAYAGDAGGPLIKLRMLSERFPEARLGYSLLYILSNAIYVPDAILKAVRRMGVPIVLNQNGVFYPSWFPEGWERENARMAAVHADATHVLYQSEFCRRAAERFLGARQGPSEILYNAVDVDRFFPAQKADAAKPFTFLLTGKIVTVAGYRLAAAVETIAYARRGGLDVGLSVAGLVDPGVEKQARALADRLNVAEHVTWLGPYRWTDAPALYRSADAYLMTKHNDPCPNVVLEALASGLPVLYLNSGGVPELVGTQAGVGISIPESFEHIPALDPKEFAQGMARIIAGHEPMSLAARSRAVDRFTLTSWLDRHEALFKDLLGQSIGRDAA